MDSAPHGTAASTTMTSHTQPSKRASTRLSTFSITPTLAPSIAPSHLSIASDENAHYDDEKQQHHNSNSNNASNSSTTSPLARDMFAVHATLARLDEPRLMNQRYIVSENKNEEISKLALGAKLEKALGRRMSGQDAVFTKGKAKAEKAVPLKAGPA